MSSDLKSTEEAFLASAKQSLDDEMSSLDMLTLQRLRQVRREAVAAAASSSAVMIEASSSSYSFGFGAWHAGAGVMATAAMMVLTVSLWEFSPLELQQQALMDEVVLLNAGEDMELIEELDFYLWLADDAQLG